MEIAVKVGHKFSPLDNRHMMGLRDGNILAIRPDGFFTGNLERKHHCIITTQHNYWALRGTHDHKSSGEKVLALRKFTDSCFSNGKYSWDYALTGIEPPEEEKRPVDFYIDFKYLLDKHIISKSQFDAIHDKTKDPGVIYIDLPLEDYIFHEDAKVRLVSEYSSKLGSITSGTYYVGSSGADYTSWKLAIDDIIDLTGDISILGKAAEEMAEDDLIIYDVNTGSYTTVFGSAAKHSGIYGGHRINWAYNCGLRFSEINDGDINKCYVQDLAFDGYNTYYPIIWLVNGFDTTPIIIQRCVAKGGTNSRWLAQTSAYSKRVIIRNNIVYDCRSGVYLNNQYAFTQWEVYNNTFIDGSYYGIQSYDGTATRGTIICKNNLILNNSLGDIQYPANINTHSKNVTSDASSPDVDYRSKDMITNSVFKDYAGNDFRLDSGGDATNLAILDDGDDLSGIGSPAQFSDDVIEQSRSTWYIGASEIVAAGGKGNFFMFF